MSRGYGAVSRRFGKYAPKKRNRRRVRSPFLPAQSAGKKRIPKGEALRRWVWEAEPPARSPPLQIVRILHGMPAVPGRAGVAAEHVGALGLVGHMGQIAKRFGIWLRGGRFLHAAASLRRAGRRFEHSMRETPEDYAPSGVGGIAHLHHSGGG